MRLFSMPLLLIALPQHLGAPRYEADPLRWQRVTLEEAAHRAEVALGVFDIAHVANIGENDQLAARDAGVEVACGTRRAGAVELAREDERRALHLSQLIFILDLVLVRGGVGEHLRRIDGAV